MNEFTIMFSYTQVDVKRNVALVNSIKLNSGATIMSIRRCGEEPLDTVKHPMIEKPARLLMSVQDGTGTHAETDSRMTSGSRSSDDVRKQVQPVVVSSNVVAIDRIAHGRTLTLQKRTSAKARKSRRDTEARKSSRRSRNTSMEQTASDTDNTRVPSPTIPTLHTTMELPASINPHGGGSWDTVNSNVVTDIFPEPPKNGKLYSFYLVIRCPGTLKSQYFDIARDELVFNSKSILINEENSVGTEAAEFIIENIGSLNVYKVIIDGYSIKSMCKKLVLKPMFNKNTLSISKSYMSSVATITDSSGTAVEVDVVVSIEPKCVTITPFDRVFTIGQTVTMSSTFFYPRKK